MNSTEELEVLLAALTRDTDPVAALARARQRSDLSPAVCVALAQIEPAGLRLHALLVSHWRAQRILRGDDALRDAVDHEPDAFVAAFRDYHAAEPPHHWQPLREAAAFRRWCAAAGIDLWSGADVAAGETDRG